MTTLPALPALAEITTSTDISPTGPRSRALALLFEPSPVLHRHLVPALHATSPPTYHALIALAINAIGAWPPAQQAAFVGAHPRIGEAHGLSALSAAEQAARATPPEVLARLGALNKAYEARFPGLRYITFVDGRSRREVMEEMQVFLGVGEGEVGGGSEVVEEVGGEVWVAEVGRAVRAVGLIARSRLRALGVDGDAPAL